MKVKEVRKIINTLIEKEDLDFGTEIMNAFGFQKSSWKEDNDDLIIEDAVEAAVILTIGTMKLMGDLDEIMEILPETAVSIIDNFFLFMERNMPNTPEHDSENIKAVVV